MVWIFAYQWNREQTEAHLLWVGVGVWRACDVFWNRADGQKDYQPLRDSQCQAMPELSFSRQGLRAHWSDGEEHEPWRVDDFADGKANQLEYMANRQLLHGLPAADQRERLPSCIRREHWLAGRTCSCVVARQLRPLSQSCGNSQNIGTRSIVSATRPKQVRTLEGPRGSRTRLGRSRLRHRAARRTRQVDPAVPNGIQGSQHSHAQCGENASPRRRGSFDSRMDRGDAERTVAMFVVCKTATRP